MKLQRQIEKRRAISMTEYLIILSIVAVAAIAVVGLFGKQIKAAFTSNTAAMSGNVQANENQADNSKVKSDDMGSFQKDAKSADQ